MRRNDNRKYHRRQRDVSTIRDDDVIKIHEAS